MKILLIGINAKYIHSNPAIYSLKAYADKYYPLRSDNDILEIAEYTINQFSTAILADIYQKKPQVAAFSCYIWNWNLIQELLVELPKLLPKTQLWLGTRSFFSCKKHYTDISAAHWHYGRRRRRNFFRIAALLLGTDNFVVKHQRNCL